jgi:hypothetical protein
MGCVGPMTTTLPPGRGSPHTRAAPLLARAAAPWRSARRGRGGCVPARAGARRSGCWGLAPPLPPPPRCMSHGGQRRQRKGVIRAARPWLRRRARPRPVGSLPSRRPRSSTPRGSLGTRGAGAAAPRRPGSRTAATRAAASALTRLRRAALPVAAGRHARRDELHTAAGRARHALCCERRRRAGGALLAERRAGLVRPRPQLACCRARAAAARAAAARECPTHLLRLLGPTRALRVAARPIAPHPDSAPSARVPPRPHRRRYTGASFTPGAAAGQWASTVTSNVTVTPSSVAAATDAPGAAGNSLPVSYVSGTSASKIIFPEAYGALEAFSLCTVTRYTSTVNRYRIFQPFRSPYNWLHGQWCVPQPARMRAARGSARGCVRRAAARAAAACGSARGCGVRQRADAASLRARHAGPGTAAAHVRARYLRRVPRCASSSGGGACGLCASGLAAVAPSAAASG